MSFEDRIRLPAVSLIQRRSQLLNALGQQIEFGSRLITVYAPGGYGKSTLLADFAQTTDLPTCWCSLEAVDRDAASFLTLLTHSINNRFKAIDSGGLLKLVALGDIYSSVQRITELMCRVGPYLIIIDDIHKAISPEMTLILNRLLERLPAKSAIIVAGRNDVTRPEDQYFDLLRVEPNIRYSTDDLRFTPLEVQKMMYKRFGRMMDLADAEAIVRATDGNIAQILLAGHFIDSDKMIGRLRRRLGDDRKQLYRYLATEVFAKQPPRLQYFLLQTSVLPDLTVDLCHDLVETTDVQACLEELVHKDLFTSRVGAGFRYEDLFAEFLRTKLADDGQVYRQVCIRAASVLAQHSRYEEAIELFLSIQAWAEVVQLLETHGPIFYETRRFSSLNRWLAQIPAPTLAQHPRLLLLYGQILCDHLKEFKLASTFFRRAEERFLLENDGIGAAESQIWISVGMRMMGRVGESLALATTGLAQLEALNVAGRTIAWALRERGITQSIAGNRSAAVSDLRRALGLFEEIGDQYSLGLSHRDLGNCLAAGADVERAYHHYSKALEIWKSSGQATDLTEGLNRLGALLAISGRHTQALQYFSQSLETATRVGLPLQIAYARAGIGDVYLDLREFRLARLAYTQSMEMAKKANALGLEISNLVKLGESFFQQQDLATALSLANQARELAGEFGLTAEAGVSSALMAKIFVRRAAYATGFELFEEALELLATDNILEQAKTRLWWASGLLLDQRASAAFEQLQEVIRITSTMGQLINDLGQTAANTRQLLIHFLHWPGTTADIQHGIRLLLRHSHKRLATSAPYLQVFTFGQPYLIAAGTRRHFIPRDGSRQTAEFLAYLLVEGRDGGCRWDQVCVDIWPELPPEKASITFHQTLRRLRDAAFEIDGYIVSHDDYYRINPRLLQWCDALEFDLLYARIGSASAGETLSLMLELISLSRGEFLAGFDLGQWGKDRRRLYEQRYLQLVKLASEQLIEAGDSRQALAILNQGLDRDYFREDLHRIVLTGYAKLELYDQLRAHYHHLRVALKREFDTLPDPITVQHYRQLTATYQGPIRQSV
jgi:DNA-binding SARP family transcriptional activator